MIFYLQNTKGGGTMEFLYKLYSNNYFGIGLFIVITVLAFAFLIILFFGKKDEKARMEMEKLETIANEALVDKKMDKDSITENENVKDDLESFSLTEELDTKEQEISDEISLETFDVNNLEENRTEDTLNDLEYEEEPIISNNLDLDLDFDIDLNKEEIFSEETSSNNFTEEQETRERNINFVEEESFDNIPSYRDNYREETTIDNSDYRKDSLEDEFLPRNNTTEFLMEENDIIEETSVKKPMPTVFSSVYKNNEREELPNVGLNLDTEESANTISQVREEKPSIVEEPTEEIKPIAPKKPEFVMPKRADMPRLNKTTENNNDSIIKF